MEDNFTSAIYCKKNGLSATQQTQWYIVPDLQCQLSQSINRERLNSSLIHYLMHMLCFSNKAVGYLSLFLGVQLSTSPITSVMATFPQFSYLHPIGTIHFKIHFKAIWTRNDRFKWYAVDKDNENMKSSSKFTLISYSKPGNFMRKTNFTCFFG